MENYKLKIMTLKDSDHIKSLLDDCQKMDVYIHPDYLKLFQEYTRNKAIYTYFGNERNYILIPYFERPVNSLENKSIPECFDLVSPWYYGGLVHNIKDNKLLQEVFNNFTKKFEEYCKKNNVVTEFQRLNPILRNHILYQNHPGLFYDRKIVYVDLTKNLETINNEYTRHTRKNINKAIRNNLKVYHGENKENISKFIKIYTESMERKNAKRFYYFNEKFFHNLLKISKGGIKIFYVECEGKIICSSIELGKNDILHDYLRGISPDHLNLRPNDILIDEIIKWAKSAGYKYFILGGGITSSEDDGLLRFKKSFSSTVSEFYVYKKIYNLEKYKKLCEIHGKKQSNLEFENAQFFPEYLKE